MRRTTLALLLPVCFAGAAQLGQISVSNTGTVVRASIQVAGPFNYSKNQLADRIYFDLAGVKPTILATQRIAVDRGVVSAIRIAAHEDGTRVVFDLTGQADFSVGQSSSGLTVEIRPTANSNANSTANSKPSPMPRKKPPARTTARPARDTGYAGMDAPSDLSRVPELPSTYRVPASPPEGAPPAEASKETTRTTPVASPPAVPVPAPAAPVAAAPPAAEKIAPPTRTRETRPESDYFDDSTSDPVFPAVDESYVEVPPSVAVFAVEDKSLALPDVLRKYNGMFAFGSDPYGAYASAMIRAADATPVPVPLGLVSLGDYRVFPIAAGKYPIVEELRRKYQIDPGLKAFATFPDAFDQMLYRQIRKAAAGTGRPGTVLAARFAFSTTDPTGIQVRQVRVRPPGMR